MAVSNWATRVTCSTLVADAREPSDLDNYDVYKPQAPEKRRQLARITAAEGFALCERIYKGVRDVDYDQLQAMCAAPPCVYADEDGLLYLRVANIALRVQGVNTRFALGFLQIIPDYKLKARACRRPARKPTLSLSRLTAHVPPCSPTQIVRDAALALQREQSMRSMTSLAPLPRQPWTKDDVFRVVKEYGDGNLTDLAKVMQLLLELEARISEFKRLDPGRRADEATNIEREWARLF
jgi:hypothetical protein